jgi:pyruvate ferredoxin oxidoreductase alpha subunit
MTMGSFSETAMPTIDNLRAKGELVGLIRIRLWRPFPFEALRKAVEGIENLLILDRAISMGGPGGPVASEVKAALYNQAQRPRIVSFVAGLGGRDITPQGFEDIIMQGIQIAHKGSANEYEIYGVRE